MKELDDSDFLKAMKASCSLPYISKMVEVKGKKYLDGGLSDSIPIRKAFEDGIDKVIALVTREEGYRKTVKGYNHPNLVYRSYPKVTEAINMRPIWYNQEVEYMEKMADEGKVLPIYPKEPIDLGRTEKNRDKLRKCYLDGYNRAKTYHDEIVRFAELD